MALSTWMYSGDSQTDMVGARYLRFAQIYLHLARRLTASRLPNLKAQPTRLHLAQEKSRFWKISSIRNPIPNDHHLDKIEDAGRRNHCVHFQRVFTSIWAVWLWADIKANHQLNQESTSYHRCAGSTLVYKLHGCGLKSPSEMSQGENIWSNDIYGIGIPNVQI